MSKVLSKSKVNVQFDTPSPPRWPSYQGDSEFVGESPSGRVTVFVDPTLGQPGRQNAKDLVRDADRVVQQNDAIFGTQGGQVDVIIFALGGNTDGTGGADHNGCDYVHGAAIEVCASFGNSARVSGLFEAELSECSMNGNLCGESTGEALSRWCAATTSNNALSDFATAPTWASSGMPDFVNTTDPTDQNPISTGCGMAFISWLISQGYALSQIAPAMVSLGDAGTLAQLYENLTGNPASQALPAFLTAVGQLPGGVTSDDPFGSATSRSLGQVKPAFAKLAGEIFAEILSALDAGYPAETIVRRVNSLLRDSSILGQRDGLASRCSVKSHRLRRASEN